MITLSNAEMSVISCSRDFSMAEVSAEMVTAAQPFVGMLWLMVRMLAPEAANTPRTLESVPDTSFSRV